MKMLGRGRRRSTLISTVAMTTMLLVAGLTSPAQADPAATPAGDRAAMDAYVGIPVGAFADPTFPAPTVSVYEERMHQWVVPPPDAEHFS